MILIYNILFIQDLMQKYSWINKLLQYALLSQKEIELSSI